MKLEFKWAPNNGINGMNKWSLNLEDFWWKNHVIWSQDGGDMIYQRFNGKRICRI